MFQVSYSVIVSSTMVWLVSSLLSCSALDQKNGSNKAAAVEDSKQVKSPDALNELRIHFNEQRKAAATDLASRKELAKDHEGIWYPGTCGDGLDNDDDGLTDEKDQFCPPIIEYCTDQGWCWENPKPFGGEFTPGGVGDKAYFRSEGAIIRRTETGWSTELLGHIVDVDFIQYWTWLDEHSAIGYSPMFTFIIYNAGTVRVVEKSPDMRSPIEESLAGVQLDRSGALWGWTRGGGIIQIPDPQNLRSLEEIQTYTGGSPSDKSFVGVWFGGLSNIWGLSNKGEVKHYKRGATWDTIVEIEDKLNDIWGNETGEAWVAGENGLYQILDGKLKTTIPKSRFPQLSSLGFQSITTFGSDYHVTSYPSDIGIIENSRLQILNSNLKYVDAINKNYHSNNVWISGMSNHGAAFFNGVEYQNFNTSNTLRALTEEENEHLVRNYAEDFFRELYVKNENEVRVRFSERILEYKDGRWSSEHYENHELFRGSRRYMTSIYFAPDGGYWAGNNEGTIIDRRREKEIRYTLPSKRSVEKIWEQSNSIWAIDSAGNLFKKRGNGFKQLIKSDISEEYFTALCPLAGDKMVLVNGKKLYERKRNKWEFVTDIDKLSRGEKVICKSRNEVVIINNDYERTDIYLYSDGTLKPVYNQLSELGGIRDLKEIDGEIWAVTYSNIVHLKNNKVEQFPIYPDTGLKAIDGTSRDNIWVVGNNGAILRYDKTKDKTRSSPKL